jgi:hypothetical protein
MNRGNLCSVAIRRDLLLVVPSTQFFGTSLAWRSFGWPLKARGVLEMFVCDKKRDCPVYARLKGKLGIAFFCLNEYCNSANFPRCTVYALLARGEEVPEGILPSTPLKDRDRKDPFSSGKMRRPSRGSPLGDSSDEKLRGSR